ncbi:MAG: penicillin acylase family protein [Methylocystis sp.]
MRRLAVTWRALLALASISAAAALVAALAGGLLLRLSMPQLDGEVKAPGLAAPVSVERDARGAPTLKGRSRADLAWALGYLHAQERFFQMDLQRRSAAGELSELVGAAALPADRAARLHRFRWRSLARLPQISPQERSVLEAYALGVNKGLSDLAAPPFEYLLLAKKPERWRAEDSILVAYAMYLTLQESDGLTERRRGDAVETLGQPMTAFLFPAGTSFDAALDGSFLPTPAIPAPGLKHASNGAPLQGVDDTAAIPGSNSFAVGGALTARGAAIVENDMHLRLREPNIWYRARLMAEEPALDITGVTLPGAPTIVAGSNGRIAWGFTNSMVDTSDVVILESADGDANRYQTPDGSKELQRFEERLCATCAVSERLTVEESIWGPVIGVDSKGRKLAYRWVAHDGDAINLQGPLDLERAQSAREALEIAHRLGVPHQNIVVGDSAGDIGWTVTGAIPRRYGHDGRTPASWANGDKGWSGYLTSQETPSILNPQSQRIWTANARVVGGEALEKLGFGAYAHGARAGQIRDALLAKSRFEEQDLLAIALDDRGRVMDRWRDLLLQRLRSKSDRPRYAELAAQVLNWGGRATPDSVGYRLVRSFRLNLISSLYGAYVSALPVIATSQAKPGPARFATPQADEPAWRLINERPDRLVPPGFKSWDEVTDAALDKLLLEIETEAGGKVEAFTWGAFNRTGVKHALTLALPALGLLLDPPDEALPGDLYQPRVAERGFGASERFVVSPGHEVTGVFHMPTGQSGHPLSPYYNSGHADWVQGRPTPFLPGETKWRLRFTPG